MNLKFTKKLNCSSKEVQGNKSVINTHGCLVHLRYHVERSNKTEKHLLSDLMYGAVSTRVDVLNLICDPPHYLITINYTQYQTQEQREL